MFKVRLKYSCRDVWINEDWIWYISRDEKAQDTVIESKHGDVLRVEETVEEVRNKMYQERIRFRNLR
nr:MAG TPA: Flagellar and Swarming motility protein [Bacteriophage sp.]